MSEVALFAGGIPAHLKNAELDDATKALMGAQKTGGNTSTGKRISIKGGVWRMVVDGQEVATNEDRHMNIVIVAAAPKDSRKFYAGAYEEGQGAKSPDCWSVLGDVPDARAKNPQASRCFECPQNAKGSSGRGDSRACKYERRLAVVLENDQRGEIFQITLPASSLWSSDNGKLGIKPYAEFLGSHGLNVTQVVTEMRFDTQATGQKINFKAVRPLEPEEITLVRELGKKPDAQRAIGSLAAELDGVKLPAPAVEEAEVVEVKAKTVEPKIKEPTKRSSTAAAEPAKDVNSILDDWAQ
jgi:hypothetical protein